MKIWLDTTPLHDPASVADDCDCDCDPDDTYQSTFLTHPVSQNELQTLYTNVMKQASPLHIQKFIEDNWLVGSPAGLGIIAVLDRSTYRLFDQFRHSRSIAEVQSSMPDVVPERAAAVAIWLYRMGLLQTDHDITPFQEVKQTLTAWLHITNICNLSCSYCYIKKSTEQMGEDTAMQSVDALFRSANLHHFQKVHLKYAGGEASLHMARVLAVHDYAAQIARQHDKELGATLLTNGVVLSQQAIDSLKQRHIHVAISLDGTGIYHDSLRPLRGGQGSFKYVNATIHRLLENGVSPHISVTVSQRNLAGLKDLLCYILDLGVSFSLSYYRENDYAIDRVSLQFGEQEMINTMREAFTAIEQRLPRRSLLGSLIDKSNLHFTHLRTCGVGNNYLVIDQHGKVAKCHANIKQTITTIGSEDPLRVVREDRDGVQNLSVDEKEGCGTCDWRYWCGGGCPLLTYRLTGRYNVKSPNCNIYRALFPEALRLEGLRLLRYETPMEF